MTVTDMNWVPHGPQLELIRVGLDRSSTADDFACWQQSIDFETMDWSLAELLPFFAARFGGDDGRISGFRRRHFYVNSIVLSRINDAVDLLAEQGIASVLGGGLAALTVYPDPSCRSLPDAELIVAAAEHEVARGTLIAAGWTLDELGRLCRDAGLMLGLAQRLRGTVEGFVVSTDDIASTTTNLTGRPMSIITGAVAVVEIAVAAVWPMPTPPVRWVVDLDLLVADLATKGELDAVVHHARSHGAAQLVRVALQLARRLGAQSIPSGLLRQLALVRTTAFERGAVMERTNVSAAQFRRDRIGAVIGR